MRYKTDKQYRQALKKLNILVAAFLFISIALATSSHADLLVLNSGEEMRGLIVEEYEDAVLVSTVDGELLITRSDISKIDYDDPAYSMLSLGRSYESEKKYGLALSYYEKAYKANPELIEAKKAAVGIRGRFWSDFAEGPLSEVAKQQEVRDAYRANKDLDDATLIKSKSVAKILWTRMGVALAEDTDWIQIGLVKIGSLARKRGLMKGDSLIAIDGKPLRNLNGDVVTKALLEPRYSSMTLDVTRKIILDKLKSRKLKALGIKLKQNYTGITITRIMPDSIFDNIGIKKNDMIVEVAGKSTRYLSLRKVIKIIKDKGNDPLSLVIKRSLQLPRK
ncbi:MAG: tetratricopeptide (TPR) repeat protein [Candidatus Omnitrophota bacterium]|jgi:tetratricopeptide (TPR) repeat protein